MCVVAEGACGEWKGRRAHPRCTPILPWLARVDANVSQRDGKQVHAIASSFLLELRSRHRAGDDDTFESTSNTCGLYLWGGLPELSESLDPKWRQRYGRRYVLRETGQRLTNCGRELKAMTRAYRGVVHARVTSGCPNDKGLVPTH